MVSTERKEPGPPAHFPSTERDCHLTDKGAHLDRPTFALNLPIARVCLRPRYESGAPAAGVAASEGALRPATCAAALRQCPSCCWPTKTLLKQWQTCGAERCCDAASRTRRQLASRGETVMRRQVLRGRVAVLSTFLGLIIVCPAARAGVVVDDISGDLSVGGDLLGSISADSGSGDITITGDATYGIAFSGSTSRDISIGGTHIGGIAANTAGDSTISGAGPHSGAITLRQSYSRCLTINGDMTGNIGVGGALTGSIVIGGDVVDVGDNHIHIHQMDNGYFECHDVELIDGLWNWFVLGKNAAERTISTTTLASRPVGCSARWSPTRARPLPVTHPRRLPEWLAKQAYCPVGELLVGVGRNRQSGGHEGSNYGSDGSRT
jgi:hypothetical protein